MPPPRKSEDLLLRASLVTHGMRSLWPWVEVEAAMAAKARARSWGGRERHGAVALALLFHHDSYPHYKGEDAGAES